MQINTLFRFSVLFLILDFLVGVASVSLILGKHTLFRPFRGTAISREDGRKNPTSSYLTTSKAYAAEKEDFSVSIKDLLIQGKENYFVASEPIEISCPFEVKYKKFRNFDVMIKANQETLLRETVKNQKQTEVKTSFAPTTSGTYVLSCEAAGPATGGPRTSEKSGSAGFERSELYKNGTNLKKPIYVSE